MQNMNPHMLGLKPYVPGKTTSEIERTYGLKNVVKLASNENPLPTSKKVLEAIQHAALELARYPEDQTVSLREKIAKHHDVETTQLTFGAGSSEVLEMLVRLLTQKDETMIISKYAFVLYKILAKAHGLNLKEIETHSDFSRNLEGILSAITPSTKMIILDNPNNPTGDYIPKNKITDFIEKVPGHVWIIMDEAYHHYMSEHADYDSSVDLIAKHPNVIVCRTFSKLYAMGGARFGYTISSSDVADYMNRLRKPFNVSSITLAAAEAAFDDQAFIKESLSINKQGIQQLAKALDALNLNYIAKTGNFITVNFGDHAQKIAQTLLERGVIVRPLQPYGLLHHLRVSIGLPEENQVFIDQLTQLLKELS